MNLFGMLFLTCALAFCIGAIGYEIYSSCFYDDRKQKAFLASIIVVVILTLVSIPVITMGTETNAEIEYITNYKTQKEVIENSLQSETLTGYERAALVNKAAELNGELAERKVVFNRWYNCYLDYSLYDNVEPINLDISKEEIL